jgi:hypothetical protein
VVTLPCVEAYEIRKRTDCRFTTGERLAHPPTLEMETYLRRVKWEV